jgi:enoyl-CoA hydratase/carnithine racemase
VTGELIDAEAALRYGRGNRLWPAAELVAAAWGFARAIASGPSLVHRLVNQAVYAGLEGGLDEALDREATGQVRCLQSRDFREGVQAFLAKRDPVFTGDE